MEQSHFWPGGTGLGIPRATFYRWYEGYREGGSDMLTDHRSRPERASAKTRTGCQTYLKCTPRTASSDLRSR
ncbi:helix-turn-helix domain-containing protein [Bradyrhizobium sp. 183]|nr:helix-turn-helix domain-containing protein [Bradyrhizobium sp. 184]UPJ87023.1 helix-turn-helix domain-containing protein [Bradyrhizobium sp. 183]